MLILVLFFNKYSYAQLDQKTYYLNIESPINNNFNIKYNLHFYDPQKKDSIILITCSQTKTLDYFNIFFYMDRYYDQLDTNYINIHNILSLNSIKDSIVNSNNFLINNNICVIFKYGKIVLSHKSKVVYTIYKDR